MLAVKFVEQRDIKAPYQRNKFPDKIKRVSTMLDIPRGGELKLQISNFDEEQFDEFHNVRKRVLKTILLNLGKGCSEQWENGSFSSKCTQFRKKDGSN